MTHTITCFPTEFLLMHGLIHAAHRDITRCTLTFECNDTATLTTIQECITKANILLEAEITLDTHKTETHTDKD